MNVSKAFDILMGRLGGRTSAALRAKCLSEAILFQTELEGAPELPWFIISESTSRPLTIGEPRILLPSDFLREVEDSSLAWVDADGNQVALEKGEYDLLEVDFGEASGDPQFYDFRGEYLILFPIPSTGTSIIFPDGYYAKQSEPEDSISSENPWFRYVPDLIMATVGFRVATLHLKDLELAQLFQADIGRAENRFVRLMTAREESNRDREMNPLPR